MARVVEAVQQLSLARDLEGIMRVVRTAARELPVDEKGKIAETVCQKIVVGRNEIDITLRISPVLKRRAKQKLL